MKIRLLTILFAVTAVSLFNSCKKKEDEEVVVFSELVFEDEFNGPSLDLSKWNYDIGNGCPGLCGWGNNEKEYYTNRSENVKIQNGYLNITAKHEVNYANSNSNFTSGKIHTRSKLNWLYGKFEARMKLPQGRGMWPAFWMLPQPDKTPYGSWPTSGEIDIMEFRGDYPGRINGTLHYGKPWNQNLHDGTNTYLPSFVNDFHIFSLEWEPGIIRWYVDGKLYKTETQSPNSLSPKSNHAIEWPWDKPFFMIFNLAVGGWYTGDPTEEQIIGTETNYTRTLQVDWVRAYKYK